jgi:hypothetical protein
MKKKYYGVWFFLLFSYLLQIFFVLLSKKYGVLVIHTISLSLFAKSFYDYSFKGKRPYSSVLFIELNWMIRSSKNGGSHLIIFLDGLLSFLLSVLAWYFLAVEVLT